MFYPVESLRRGGRFYLCWVADSWPLRFAATTHRQLWAQDIRKLCDDLREVIMNESGRPCNRFSLRLSSQLLRGLVRLYERKATVLLSEMCMMNAHVMKHANKKYVPHQQRPLRTLPPAHAVATEEPEPEERVVELIQNSGNVVINIQDITLKEATIPDFQLPPNDNFGEENPDQALQQLLGDRPLEMMLAPTDVSAVQHSGLEQLDATEKSHDKTRLALHHSAQMERLSDLDVTMFRKSVPGEVPPAEFEKDIPEIPDIPPPVMPMPAPQPEIEVIPPQPEEPQAPIPVVDAVQEVPAPEPEQPAVPEKPPQREPETIELEELEVVPAARRRRRKAKIIIDKRTKLGADFLRPRTENPHVELRCANVSDDIVDPRVPWNLYKRRPCAGGARLRQHVSPLLVRVFQQRLATATAVQRPAAVRDLLTIPEEIEPEAARRRQTEAVPPQEAVPLQEAIPPQEAVPPQDTVLQQEIPPEMPTEVTDQTRLNITAPEAIDPKNLNVTTGEVNITTGVLNLSDILNIQPQVAQMDIADLPTQKLQTLSQRKRKATEEGSPSKRQRSGYVSFRESQETEKERRRRTNVAADKENIPPAPALEQENIIEVPQPVPEYPIEEPVARDTAKGVSAMLQEAGLADRPSVEQEVGQAEIQVQQESRGPVLTRRNGSDSETPLGSLERTKVSLGDSDKTTDSQKLMRKHWGTEGTMLKILRLIKEGNTAVTVESLTARGPRVSGRNRIVAALCFSSILKLKQHGFIKVLKDPETSAILDITLGPRFDIRE